jgi:hypothetical protein
MLQFSSIFNPASIAFRPENLSTADQGAKKLLGLPAGATKSITWSVGVWSAIPSLSDDIAPV